MAEALRFDLIANPKGFTKGTKEAERSATGLSKTVGRVGGVIVGAFAGGAVLGGIKSFVDAARDSQRVAAETEARIRSTKGATGLSAKGFADLAGAVSKYAAVDDDVIQGGENMLATFDKIKAGGPNQTFEKATKAAVDLAAGMNQGQVTAEGLQTANIQLGKALQDPIKGIGALSKIGVSFTQQQKDQIAAMVKAGDTAGAQGVILKAVNSQFAGSAGAAVTSGKRLAVTWGNMQEVLGGLLIPVIDKGSTVLAGLVGWVDRNRTAAAAIGGVLAGVAGVMLAVSVATKVVAAGQAVARGATVAWSVATKVMAAGQWLLNAALNANPIGLVVAGVALLAAGIIYAYRHSETFRKIVQAAFGGVKTAVGAAVTFIIASFRSWWDISTTVVAGILHLFGKLPGPMGAPFRRAEQAVKDAKKTVDAQLAAIQARVNRLTGKDIPVTASLKLNFSKSFTQRDWLAAKVAAGRAAKGMRITRGTTATADDVLIAASKGETVVSAADSARGEFRAWAAARRIPGYARGGMVGDAGDAPGARAVRGIGSISSLDAEARAVNRVEAKGAAAILRRGLPKLVPAGGWFGAAPGALGRVFALGRQQLGKPYRWGATGPGSFDCSGLMWYLFRHAAGINLPRTTGGEWAGLPRGGNAPGQLVLFDRGNIHHVGLVLGGNRMLNAPHTGAVVRVQSFAGRSIAGYRNPWRTHAPAAGITSQFGGRVQLDQGGWIPPRTTMLVTNGTRQPERVGPPGAGRWSDQDFDRMADAFVRALERHPPTVAVRDIKSGLLKHKRDSGGLALGLT